jgi:LysM repeat protein
MVPAGDCGDDLIASPPPELWFQVEHQALKTILKASLRSPNQPIYPLMSSFVRLSMLAAMSALLASCQTGQKASVNDPYVANFGNDGAYRPYPGQPGTMQSGGGGHVATPTYTAPPTPPPAPPPVQNDPYAFSGPSTAPSKPASVASHTTTTTKPKSPSSSGSSKPKTTAKKKSSGSYTVVKGDTLSAIARKRGSSVAKIKAANKLTSDLIRPGQALKIP